MIARFFSYVCKNFAGFGIFLPFAFPVLLGHKTLLAHEEQIEAPAGLARLAMRNRACGQSREWLRPCRRQKPPVCDGARNFAGTIGRSCDASASSHRDVVGAAQYLDRDDESVGKSRRYIRRG